MKSTLCIQFKIKHMKMAIIIVLFWIFEEVITYTYKSCFLNWTEN